MSSEKTKECGKCGGTMFYNHNYDAYMCDCGNMEHLESPPDEDTDSFHVGRGPLNVFSCKTYKYMNKKNKHIYLRVVPSNDQILDCTNVRDGTEVVLYTRDGKWYIRERQEFFTKFIKVPE